MNDQAYQKLQQLKTLAPQLQEGLTKTAGDTTASQFLKSDADHTASAIYMAARSIYGIGMLDWEPETIWLNMKKDGIDLSEEDRDKLMAAITLQKVPSFYWDNLVFQRTVQSLNGVPYDPEALQEPAIAHIMWAIHEAAIIRGLDPEDQEVPQLDEDVQQFIAVCLHRAGWITPPKDTSYLKDNLQKLLPKNSRTSRIKNEVEDAWDQLDKEALSHTEFAENALGVQLAKRASCYLYVAEKSAQFASEALELS